MGQPDSDGRDTRARILDAAERLFADHGFNGASMRAITSDAGANVAAVHYHFGSKEALIEEVFHRRLAPLNAERLALLDRLDDEAGDATPSLEDVVEAFVGPALRMQGDPECGGPVFMRLLGHTLGQPHGKIRELFTRQFEEVFRRFTVAFRAALPDLPEDEMVWGFLFMVGSMAHTMAFSADIARISRGAANLGDVDGAIRRLVPFVCSGFRFGLGDRDGSRKGGR